MAIVERLMKPGLWDLALLPQTPKAILDILQPFGHIVICEARVDPRVMLDADLLGTVALFVGVLRRKPTPFKLTGATTTLWAGDEEGKGNIISPNLVNATFVTWINNILGGPVTAGSVTAVGVATLTWSATWVTQRAAMDYICNYFSGLGGGVAEYRVNNNGTVDAGLSSALFPATPTVIAMPREGGREVGGLVGIEPASFNPEIDADSYSSGVFLQGKTGTGTAAVATTYKDLHGNLANLTRAVQSPLTLAGQENTVATQQLTLYPLRQVITVSTDRYNLVHDIRAGNWLWVYDPEHDIIDLTNPQNYRGQIVYPNKLRVLAISWPVEPGMSVYYRDRDGVYTDITVWVQFEQPGTVFEVGYPVRGLTVA